MLCRVCVCETTSKSKIDKMTGVQNYSPIMRTILIFGFFFSFVDCFAGDYNTNPKIRINYLSQNSGKKIKFIFLNQNHTNKNTSDWSQGCHKKIMRHIKYTQNIMSHNTVILYKLWTAYNSKGICHCHTE